MVDKDYDWLINREEAEEERANDEFEASHKSLILVLSLTILLPAIFLGVVLLYVLISTVITGEN